ncbi:MAG: thioether cross-link-forming SCIFF peptide maturase [Candidatus Eremiobacteraeota bacterium]|nr:thioether cross-link-forming SCIFF peptide maturase [Candidatus Eremiobacteraeota bacterium]
MKLRPGDYHIFRVNGDTLLAIASGEIFILDELADALVESGADSEMEAQDLLAGRFPEESIGTAYREMNKVFSRPIPDHRKDKPPRKLRALCLNITHKCNLACKYCFAANLTAENAPSMTSEVVRAAFDYLISESKGVRRLQMDFFGGEPLLVFDLVKEGVSYGREKASQHGKEVFFTLTTNATLLDDEKIDFIKNNDISLILSLDGRRNANDRFRVFPNDKGSYDTIIQNIDNARNKLGKNDYYIRGTFTSQTPDILDTMKFYLEKGYYHVSLEPVTADERLPYAFKDEHIPHLLESYRKLASWLIDKPLCFYHFNIEMDNPLCLTRRITGCGAGMEYMAVDPWGDLYPCHQFIENPDFKIGNVFEGVNEKDIVDYFHHATVYDKNKCNECWARFYCSGGCHYQQYVQSGDIKKPSRQYCELFRGRLEIALWYNVKRKTLNQLISKNVNKS